MEVRLPITFHSKFFLLSRKKLKKAHTWRHTFHGGFLFGYSYSISNFASKLTGFGKNRTEGSGKSSRDCYKYTLHGVEILIYRYYVNIIARCSNLQDTKVEMISKYKIACEAALWLIHPGWKTLILPPSCSTSILFKVKVLKRDLWNPPSLACFVSCLIQSSSS